MSEKRKKLTINDVAAALDVSVTTVSRAISGKGRIGEETRQKVLDYIKLHNYSPNSFAGRLTDARTNNIAIIIPEVKELIDLPFFYTCMYGVDEVALANGYDMFVVTTNGKDTTHLEEMLDKHKVDGMILGRTYRNDVFAQFLKERNVPFVTVGSLEDSSVLQVDHDNKGACRDLTSILLSRKWRRIAYLGNTGGQVVNEQRFAGYMQAHEDVGVPIDWSLVSRENQTETMMRKKIDEMLIRKVDCILCQDDSICNIVLQELRSQGARIPEDMRVAPCHNSEILDSYPISVTSLKFDSVELGRTACRVLLDFLAGRPVQQKTVLDYEVVIKESTK